MPYEKKINDFLFSADKSKLQVDTIYNYLCKESYWSQNIPLETVKASIDGSICFAIYIDKKQIGYGRVITDNATFGYLADVFILEEYRGRGLSKSLIEFILEYPGFKNFRRFMLATKDAHALYEKMGFTSLSTPERFMEKKPFEQYSK